VKFGDRFPNPDKKMFAYFLAFVVLLLPLASCGKQEKPRESKPLVLVSVPPYIYFVDRIAGGAVDVESLIPPGVNPHIYEATPREVQRHQAAALWIYLGEAFDKKTLDFFKKSRKPIEIFPVTQGIHLLSFCEEEGHTCPHHAHEEGKDLHIWLSPRLAKKQAEGIAIALGELLPTQKQQFSANLKNFLQELDELDKEISILLAPMRLCLFLPGLRACSALD
jgi:zinc transport system substrate-binding protein